MLAQFGLVGLLAAAGFAQRGAVVDFWLPIAFGAVAIIAYAGLAKLLPAVMGANP